MKSFSCGTAARWLPRTLAGAILIAFMIAAFRLDRNETVAGSGFMAIGVMAMGAMFALGVLRSGGEVRQVVTLKENELEFVAGKSRATLPLSRVASIGFELPFAGSRRWLPAWVLTDTAGHDWRISALMQNGASLLREFLRRAGRNDFDAWSEVLSIESRLQRQRGWLAAGYLVAATCPFAASLLFML